MSDLLDRAYQVARGYLDAARGRIEAIDARAQEELQRALPREALTPGPSPNAGRGETDDPFARAAAKIAAAQQQAAAQRQARETPVENAPPPDPVTTAYKIIGVPTGADYATVRAAVDQLRARCAPSRFPEGSAEQAEAQVILQRVEEAFQVLDRALNPDGDHPDGGGRFDKLEL